MNDPADSSDCVDHWVAEYLDWLDGPAGSLESAATASELVDRFLQQSEQSFDVAIRQALMAFAADDQPTTAVTATATLSWIDGAKDAVEPLPRDFGDYRLLEIIGRGGMGVVYRATQKSLRRAVCVKLATPGMDQRSRLVREARLAGELHHPGIVRVFDAGIHDGQSFIAMEYVEGQTLSTVLASQPMAARPAAKMLIEVCDAVAFAHRHGILHRDLKPSNVIVDQNGRPRVTDFGLAKRLAQRQENAADTIDGIAGSPSYMAPEQADEGELTVRTDVYGIGAILYEMLSGRPPLVGNSVMETIRLVQTSEPIELGRLQIGLPKDLETICHKCLQKRPLSRYGDVAELRADVQRFLDDIPTMARPIGPMTRIGRWLRRNPSISGAVGAVILSIVVMLLGLTWMLAQTRDALERTILAESSQRALAGELSDAVDASNQALYRSLIIQASRSLASQDVPAARRALVQMEANQSLIGRARIEYEILHRRSWPAVASIPFEETSIAKCGWTVPHGRLVTVDSSGIVRLHEPNGTEIKSVGLDVGHVSDSHLVMHAEKNVAAVVTGDAVYTIDLSSMTVDRRVGFGESVSQVVWHPHESVLLGLSDRNVVLACDLSADRTRSLSLAVERPRRISVSQDGHHLAVVTENEVRVWRWLAIERTSSTTRKSVPPDAAIATDHWPIDIAWLSSDGPLAVLDDRGSVRSYQVSDSDAGDLSAELYWSNETASHDVFSICASENMLVVIADDELTSIFPATGELAWRHPMAKTDELRVNSTGSMIAVVEPGSSRLDLLDTNQLASPQIADSTGVPIRLVSVGNQGKTIGWRNVDGKIVAGNDEWPTQTIELVETALPATGLAFNPVRDQMVVSRGNAAVCYQLPQLTESVRLTKHESPPLSVTYSSDGRYIATGDFSGKVAVWEAETGTVRRWLGGSGSEVRCLRFSDDGNQLIVADANGNLRICDASSGKSTLVRTFDDVSVNAIASLSPKSIVCGDSRGRIHVIDARGESVGRPWLAHDGPVWSLASTADRILSAGQDGSIRVWDQQGNLVLNLADFQDPIWSIGLSAKSKRILGSTTTGDVISISW